MIVVNQVSIDEFGNKLTNAVFQTNIMELAIAFINGNEGKFIVSINL